MVTDHDFDLARGAVEKASTGAVELVRGAQQAEVESSRGAGSVETTAALSKKGGTESGTVVAQNAAQQLHAAVRKDSHDQRANPSPTVTSAKSRDSSRDPAKPTNGEGGIRTRGPAFDRTRL
jgi:hypothetical protein